MTSERIVCAQISYWQGETCLYEYVSQGYIDEFGEFVPATLPSVTFTSSFNYPLDTTIKKITKILPDPKERAMKVIAVYRWDAIQVIRGKMILRNLHSVFKENPIGEAESSWRQGYNAACCEIEIAIRDLKKCVAEHELEPEKRGPTHA